MGHSEDDAIHKIRHKMETHRQNQLKLSVFVNLKSSIESDMKKIDVILVQYPFSCDFFNFQGVSM